MGYDTTFTGHVTITPPLNAAEISYLKDFASSRRFQRHSGPYTAPGNEFRGFDTIDYNSPPTGQPNLWCQWMPSDDGTRISWDGNEKFHDAEQWMTYLIDTFLKPSATLAAELADPAAGRHYDSRFQGFIFCHVVNGRITAEGKGERYDIVVVDNHVTTGTAAAETVEPEHTETDTREPNFFQTIMIDLAEQLDGCDEILLSMYAVLALTLGPQTTLDDVHIAWSGWKNLTDPQHRSLIPFDQLAMEVQELDRKYLEAIHNTALSLCGPYETDTCICDIQHTHA